MSSEELNRTTRLGFVTRPLVDAGLTFPVRQKSIKHGTVTADSGALILRRENGVAPTTTFAALTLRLQASTVRTGDYRVDEKLRSIRELHVVEYPFWTLDVDVTARTGVNTWTGAGALDSRGVTAPCELALSLLMERDAFSLHGTGVVGRHRGPRRSVVPILRAGGAFEVYATLQRRDDVAA